MSRRRGIVLLALAALVLLLGVNTVVLDAQTKDAEVTAEGGKILELAAADIQVVDSGEPASGGGQPVVLLHCYTCSLHWFERLAPLLAKRHRVVSFDLLGFGGSEKPKAGYGITEQAKLVAEGMNQLDLQGALVVGSSMGGDVAASLAEQASQLVDRAVVIGTAPNTTDFGDGLPLLSKLGRVPVLGEAMWRLTPDFAIRDAVADASFADGFDPADGFQDPDQIVEDFRAMTYSSYDAAAPATEDFAEALPLDRRFTAASVPLMAVFGAEDALIDAEAAVEGYADVPGVRTSIIPGAGHAAQVEKPGRVAALIEEFAVDPDDSAGLPRNVGRDRGQRRRGDSKRERRRGGG